MDFNHIIGHQKIKENLKRVYMKDRISHCYLFEGEESLGKKKMALAFAKALLCKEEGPDPCNTCRSCLRFDNHNHPDLELIEAEGDLIKKKVIDDLTRDMTTPPFESKRRIIIIDDCHRIRMEGQNALLKTLEEPPSYINIILITSNRNDLIATVVSRCQIIKFHPIENQKIISLLEEKYNKTREEACFIADFSKGSIGKAITIARSDDFMDRRDKTIEIISEIMKGDKLRIFDSTDFFMESKGSYQEILDIILMWFRDLSIYQSIGNSELIINKDRISTLSNQSYFNPHRISDIMDSIEDTKKFIYRNVNYQLAIETMLLKMQEV